MLSHLIAITYPLVRWVQVPRNTTSSVEVTYDGVGWGNTLKIFLSMTDLRMIGMGSQIQDPTILPTQQLLVTTNMGDRQL